MNNDKLARRLDDYRGPVAAWKDAEDVRQDYREDRDLQGEEPPRADAG